MAKITGVIAGDNYLLFERFDGIQPRRIPVRRRGKGRLGPPGNSFTALIRVRPFFELRDKQVLTAARTDGKVIYWLGGLSLTIGELVELVAK